MVWRGLVTTGNRRSSMVGGGGDSSSSEDEGGGAGAYGGPSEAQMQSLRIYRALNRMTNNLRGVNKIVIQVDEFRFELDFTVRFVLCCAAHSCTLRSAQVMLRIHRRL